MNSLLVNDLSAVKKDKCLKAYDAMVMARALDEKCFKMVRQNKGGTFHVFATGHEMVGVVAAHSLISGKDWGLPYYRDRAFVVGLGCTAKELLASFLARETSHHSGGRMMPEHFSHRELKIPCQSSCVGSQILHAVGVAKALQAPKTPDAGHLSAGDRATSQRDFHDALNFSCIHRLGVIFVIQDNDWAISVPKSEQTAGGTIVEIALGYQGLSVFDVDGCNYDQLSSAMDSAVAKARAGEGPSLVVAKVPRLGPHSSSDDPAKYKTAQVIEAEKARDPVPLFEAFLQERKMATQEELKARKQKIMQEVEAAALEAEQIPFPKKESAATGVFKETDQIVLDETPSKKEALVMVDALNRALDEAMQKEAGVLVFGQDVAHGKGGVFGVTRNLTAKYGVRCFNTPLAESTIIGIAIGMSLVPGFKPVAEIQFADYLWTGINQLFNELSSIYYRSSGEWNCPVVVRMPCGGYIQGGPYHSQSIEGFLAHCPGLKIVIPSNSADAKRLLKTAIRDPNPVVFLEHKALYRQRVFCAQPEPEEDALLPFGKAKIVREGDEITFVGWGMMVVMGFEVAEKLSKEGISVEVIDLRTIAPFDLETVLTSLKKTGKLLIAHEAAGTAGFGAEIAAQVIEKGFSYLDAPIVRVTGKDCPVPYCKDLENAVLPQVEDLELALRKLSRF